VKPWPTKVMLPSGLAVSGAVLVDQMRSVDRNERVLRTIGRVPSDIVSSVREKLAALTGLEFPMAQASPTGD
jgi:mRNA interferase MazF